MGVFLYFSFIYFIPVLLMDPIHCMMLLPLVSFFIYLALPLLTFLEMSGISPMRKNYQCNNEACKFLERSTRIPHEKKTIQWNPQQSLQILESHPKIKISYAPPPLPTPHQWNNEVYKYLDKITMVKISSGATKSTDSWIKIPWTKIPVEKRRLQME